MVACANEEEPMQIYVAQNSKLKSLAHNTKTETLRSMTNLTQNSELANIDESIFRWWEGKGSLTDWLALLVYKRPAFILKTFSFDSQTTSYSIMKSKKYSLEEIQ